MAAHEISDTPPRHFTATIVTDPAAATADDLLIPLPEELTQVLLACGFQEGDLVEFTLTSPGELQCVLRRAAPPAAAEETVDE